MGKIGQMQRVVGNDKVAARDACATFNLDGWAAKVAFPICSWTNQHMATGQNGRSINCTQTLDPPVRFDPLGNNAPGTVHDHPATCLNALNGLEFLHNDIFHNDRLETARTRG